MRLVAGELHFDWRFAGQRKVANGILRPRAVVATVEHEDGIAQGVLAGANPDPVSYASPDLDSVRAEAQGNDDGLEVADRDDLGSDFVCVAVTGIDDGVRLGVRVRA